MARLVQAVKRFRTGSQTVIAVDGVSFTVADGDRLAIIGESGSGKSTIARLLLGTILCDAGRVEVLGQDWRDLGERGRRALRAQIGAVYQEPLESLDPRMRVHELIAEPLVIHGREGNRAELASRIDRALEQVMLSSRVRDRYPAELSGGQAQRVSIARALIVEPRVLIFDEPTSALDVSVQAQILGLLEELSEEQRSAWVFVTHDLAVAAEVCNRAIVAHRGRVVEQGGAVELVTNPRDPYTRRLVESLLPRPAGTW